MELHILQNIAPASLNRNEAHLLKDCTFGGVRRARISSQCWKRAMRTYVRENALLPEANLAKRSRKFPEAIALSLAARGRHPEEAQTLVLWTLDAAGLGCREGELQYLVFLGSSEMARLTDLIDQQWDALTEASGKSTPSLPDDLLEALNACIRDRAKGGDAVDLALFGRMMPVAPGKGQDPACQVAHVIGTHSSPREFDFFVALDDLALDQGDRVARHLGDREFSSACYYRYIAFDLDLLRINLAGDLDLATAGLEAFLKAAVLALPSGGQNGFAAHNQPGLVIFRHSSGSAPRNLVNAFERPVFADASTSLTLASQRALADYWLLTEKFLGGRGKAVYWSQEAEDFSPGKRVKSLEKLIGTARTWVRRP